jgi:CHAT domain-containing protein
MADFYDGLLAGRDVPEALRRATTRVREQKTTSHPYYWAGYQSFGSR